MFVPMESSTMIEELKSFLQANMQLISENDFRTLYKEYANGHEDISPLTEILTQADINPLLYLPEVPVRYANYVESLKQVYIPGHISKVLQFAFKGCENLEEVVLPASIKLISRYAFMTESNNLTIKYAKSSDDFAHLDMMYNSFDPTAIIQCTDKTATFREITDDVWDWSKI